MWRVLIQLPSLISELITLLRTLSWLSQQSLLIQQETNLLLRELIVKVTTQPAETPEAAKLDLPTHTDPLATPRAKAKTPDKPYRVRTEHDIIRNTRSSIAAEQFRQEGLQRFPHRQGEQLPTDPHQRPSPATRPMGGPPGA